tara:strand:- start:4027 stop:4392 length:366 start_codon:yes stop_codon:yes gene_type:complete
LTEFAIGNLSEVPVGKSKVFKVSNKTVAIFNIGGTLYAISDICRFGGDSLSEGELFGHTVKCLKHGYQYNVTNGHCNNHDGMNIESFNIKIEKDEIVINIARPSNFDNWKANYRKNDKFLE